ncbi:MAG: CRISPR-associated endonuclease Cas2 [Thermodesulfobacteriota bacterium]
MFYLISFDVSDDRVRYRVVKALKGCGVRVQKSVFECPDLTEKRLAKLQTRLAGLIDHLTDSVRYYRLCGNCLQEVEWTGTGEAPETRVHLVA